MTVHVETAIVPESAVAKRHCMSQIAIWCTVASEEYELVEFTLDNAVSHPAVRRIFLVVTGPDKPDQFGYLSRRNAKFREVYRAFGSGYDLSLEEGGYDQVSARNFALELAEECDSDWLMQYDADDYYDERIFDAVSRLHDVADSIACSCHTLVSERSYWYVERLRRRFGPLTLLNPHTRIWKRSLRLRFEPSTRAVVAFRNATRHCGVRFPPPDQCRAIALDDVYHFHLHCLLGKRYSLERNQGWPFEGSLPESLQVCISRLKHRSKIVLPDVKI